MQLATSGGDATASAAAAVPVFNLASSSHSIGHNLLVAAQETVSLPMFNHTVQNTFAPAMDYMIAGDPIE